MLKVEGLTKRYQGTLLFEGLSFEAREPMVLWAPSGWGKTTLMRILMGLEKPDEGQVLGVGRVAAVFQEDRLCPQLSALENVELVLPEGRRRRAALEADFARLGMEGASLCLPAGRLSGGQKRRVALMRALWAEADTLLLDEPFTGMDPDTLLRAAALVRERCGDRPTLLASHEQQALEALGWPVLDLGLLGD